MPFESQLVLTTAPDRETAETIATALVEERLAACVNIIPEMTSVYRWKQAVEKESELLLLIKSCEQRYEELENRIRSLHPYELPEIIAVSLKTGDKDYIKWIEDCVTPE